MTKFRPMKGKDREAVRSMIDGTGAFKPHEVDVAMELVDEAFAQPGQDDYHPFVLEEEDGARSLRCQFGQALLATYEENFPAALVASARRARELIESVLAWLDAHPAPAECRIGWGQWIVETPGNEVVPPANEDLRELLIALDDIMESDVTLGRYLSQIAPLGKDRAANESEGVRIMNMAAAKGLTVRATIIGALEEGIIPRPLVDLAEERRFLYVAMTRAKEVVYGTWARRRKGPTARVGTPRVIARRSHSHFLNGGPVESQDGDGYILARWGRA